MTDKLSVAVGAGIAVAGVLVFGSWQASATPASGVALIHAIQKAEAGARYHIPRYRRCRVVGYRLDRQQLRMFRNCITDAIQQIAS
jgi:hypothetical protein